MFVTIVSHCQGKARNRSFSLIDRYATRIGDNVWTTQITMEALKELCRGLKSKVSKFTSVAIYRNKGYNYQELYALIGSKKGYDRYGRYAIGTSTQTQRWPMFFRHAALLAAASGMSHDFGKMTEYFQGKILDNSIIKDPIRHELISAWIFDYLSNKGSWDDKTFINAWEELKGCLNSLQNGVINLWQGNESVQDAIKYNIITHHKMFGPTIKDMGNTPQAIPHQFNYSTFVNEDKRITEKMKLDMNKIKTAQIAAILKKIESKQNRLENIKSSPDYLNGLSFISRAALILADHEISSKDEGEVAKNELIANSKKKYSQDEKEKLEKGLEKQADQAKKDKRRKKITDSKHRQIKAEIEAQKQEIEAKKPKQSLDFHLKGVSKRASELVAHFNPEANGLPALEYYSYENLLLPGDTNSRFAWQDKAVDFLKEYKNTQTLVLNVASTGAGKTFMNVRALMALREGEPVRISSVLNLRSLTLQTHSAYKKDLGLQNDECVCTIGDLTIRKLHEAEHQDAEGVSASDKEDSETDYEEDVEVTATSLEANVPSWLNDLSKQKKGSTRDVIGAPLLVSTIDYLIAAGEPHRQAHHAVALLRAASSDLIIDEIDSYDVKAFVAVLRLITVHAMLGRNIVISSATLMPESVQAIADAFNTGLRMRKSAFSDTSMAIVTISDTVGPEDMGADSNVYNSYQSYCQQIAQAKTGTTKKFKIAKFNPDKASLHEAIANSVLDLHNDQGFAINDSQYEKVSVGLVRVANIKACMEIASYIKNTFSGNSEYEVRVCTYHAREVLSRRFYKESYLDHILNRKDKNNPNARIESFIKDELKSGKDSETRKNLILIVVATPVEEVGRDHDFDWAIIEPSSMHSIIQTAGRVNRHRLQIVSNPNIILLQYNVRYVEGEKTGRGVFVKPGFEIRDNQVSTHNQQYDLTELLKTKDDLAGIDFQNTPLDYSYIFGTPARSRSLFAEYDAGSIAGRINKIKDILSFEDRLWASKWFNEAFPLRSKEHKTQYHFKDVGKGNLGLFERRDTGQTPKMYIDSVLNDHEDLDNTFLSPTLQESLVFVHNKDKTLKIEHITTFDVYGNSDEISISWKGVETR
ncbi:CRISPR-associated helicase Cas3 family [Desulfonatronospira thiodismutans ASO3-1]|uniref:CRISPR-associated helicase Cas3 family n=1 Tax=Desulfonatronospira thiodismutans ASO3-1 TaxID=555779 RepID=D6SNR3_9BACT|nr:CRISPR-associated helicase Cas3 family [Desulfonatronospira thiodismutans]EFI34389.1 CRISPR-associated helicase Cas3 family [Desulfonatronospira thiodismutans ASO3-1]